MVDNVFGRNGYSVVQEAVKPSQNGTVSLRSGIYNDEFSLDELKAHKLRETITELQLELDDRGWRHIGYATGDSFDFDRDAVRSICRLSRLNFLKNPIIKRGVAIQAIYVWGQGVEISARDPDIAKIIKRFWDDKGNKAEFTGHRARTLKECDLQVDGNIFFALFTNPDSGAVSIRTLPVNQVDKIIHHPEDRKDPWFYVRKKPKTSVEAQLGVSTAAEEYVVYRDWELEDDIPIPSSMPGAVSTVRSAGDNVVVFHTKVGGLSEMQFGIPETYQAIDWARAYKEFLEDWATIVKSLSRFAWKLTGPSSGNALAAAQAAMGTTVTESTDESNPAAAAGSLFYESGEYSLTPMPKTGATIQADDGRRLLLMALAALGIPETFTGDVSVGTLATAESLDRPTELKFRDRQTLWVDVIKEILQYVIIQAAKAGYLGLSYDEVDIETEDEVTETEFIVRKGGKVIDTYVDVNFPPILERDMKKVVDSVISAATLDGKSEPAIPVIPRREVTRKVMQALDIGDIDGLLKQMYNEDGTLKEDGIMRPREEKQPIPTNPPAPAGFPVPPGRE